MEYTFHDTITFEIEIHAGTRFQKNRIRSGEYELDLMNGVWPSKKYPRGVHKTRRIDKAEYTYYEHVVDIETGNVIKHQEHDLRNHQWHGSAKFNR